MALAAGAWVLHVGALALAPISLVQAVLSTGVVILAVLGAAFFGCCVTRRQWTAVAMTATGLALGALLIVAPRLGAPPHHHGALLGAAAGALIVVQLAAFGLVAPAALVTPAGHGPAPVLD